VSQLFGLVILVAILIAQTINPQSLMFLTSICV
jgi:hypothetical protein